jgi:transcriptional regulator with XRE-family HTH domain
MQELQEKIGTRIRALRKERGWSQEVFADSCGIHRGHMGEIERGEKNLSITTLAKVANGLGITVSALLKGIV